MRETILAFIFSIISLHGEDFISRFEYGQMLYENPRGVSCVPCHGNQGEGKVIASYIDDDGEKKILKGSDIRFSTLQDMLKAVHKGPSVMPKYFLTDDEIEAIYEYIQKVNQSDDDNSTNDIDW